MKDYIASMNRSSDNITATIGQDFILQTLTGKLGYPKERFTALPPSISEIRAFLSLPDDNPIYQSICKIVFHVIKRFTIRMDTSIGPVLITEEMERDLKKIGASNEKILKYAEDFWQAVANPRSSSKTKIKIWPEAAVKLCHLNISLSSTYDWLFLDEVEEFKPSFVAFLNKFRQSKLIVTEGIYPFNLPTSMYSLFPVTRRMVLTRSYTVSKNVATVANSLVRMFLKKPMDMENGNGVAGEVYPPASPPKVVFLNQSVACIGSMKDLLLYGVKIYELILKSEEPARASSSSSLSSSLSLSKKKSILFSDPDEMQKYAKDIQDGFRLYVRTEEPSIRALIEAPSSLSSFADYGQLIQQVKSGNPRYAMIADFTRSYRNLLMSMANQTPQVQQQEKTSGGGSVSEPIAKSKSPDPDILASLVKQWDNLVSGFVKHAVQNSSSEQMMLPHDDIILLTTPGFTRGLSFDHVVLLEDFCDVFTSKTQIQQRPPLKRLHSLYLSITRARQSLYLNTEVYQLIQTLHPEALVPVPMAKANANTNSNANLAAHPRATPSSKMNDDDDQELGDMLPTS